MIITKHRNSPPKVWFVREGSKSEVVLGVGAGGYVEVPLDLLAEDSLQAIHALQGVLGTNDRDLAVPGSAASRFNSIYTQQQQQQQQFTNVET